MRFRWENVEKIEAHIQKKDKNTLYQNSILCPKTVRLELLSNFEFPAL